MGGEKVKSLGLLFEDERKNGYAAGDTVAGHVLLEATEPLACRALRLEAVGGARARGRARAPTGEVPCLSVRRSLGEPGPGEDVILLQPGKHEFPFSFQLPAEPLVTSFTGKYGSIQYWVRAILERPLAPDQSVKRELQVINHIDVNTPALITPISRTQEKMVGCCFLASGLVSLSAKIDRKGYCNGEAIPIYAEIENCSSRLIVPKAAIIQTQTYLASGKTKTVRQMVANVRGNHIASGSTDTWNGKTLKIPPVSPSILNCSIIRVDYFLAVYVHIPGAKKLRVELPLVIGTIPYNGFGSRNSSVASQFSMDMSWLTLTLPEHPEAPPNYGDVVSEEEYARHIPPYPQPLDCEREMCRPMLAYIQEFRFQPPPLYSEVDPHPSNTEEIQPVSFIL
ncbi:arrestin domain-containing protein 4 [Tachyglossus aculeatus]|uniref:arrestin domain-containing protein 4 n=1 Tax=Tachyglossus aculeatus TaxID=9261 RepID=UPI0018F35793|nr:arrestin domain-containing protein 4 [Tachyglossus aculeatus]